MKRTIAALLLYLGLASVALAQTFTLPPPAGVTMMGCVYNATPPTWSTGQVGYVQCSNNGTLLGSGGGGEGSVTQGTTPWVDNITQWASTVLGNPTAYGTAPTTGNYIGVNAFTTNLPTVAVNTAPVTATNPAVVVDLRPDSPGIITLGPAAPASAVPTIPSSPYPANAVGSAAAIEASSGNVAAATAAATLPAAASKFTYISGFQFTSSGSTVGLPVICTITGITTTKSYIVTSVAGVLLANAPLIVTFNPPLPSSAVNTAIVVSCPSLGTGNTNAVMTADGYQL